jgi:hypothetical protein
MAFGTSGVLRSNIDLFSAGLHLPHFVDSPHSIGIYLPNLHSQNEAHQ